MDPLFEIVLDHTARGARTASQWLHDQLRAAILDGRLLPGSRLPSTRRAAAHFGVSRNTAAEVYRRLVQERHLTTRRGAGTYVASPPQPRRKIRARSSLETMLNPFWRRPEVISALGFWRDTTDRSAAGAPPPRSTVIDFRPALIDPQCFPFDQFRGSTARALRAMGRRPPRLKSAQGNQGSHALRVAIRQHLSLTRGVACEPDEIVVTAGAQQAFDLLARVLVPAPGTVVVVEDPGYPPMRVPFAAAGARLVPVGVDEEGLRVDEIPRDARIICVCPAHQFPLGTTLSARRRQALLALARRQGALIVEDDYDGEFRHAASPIGPLRGRGADDRVFYVGTFSKCMLPALRLGYMVVPEWALPALVVAKNSLDWHCPTPMQLAVADFITEGLLARHVTRMRRRYDDRRQALLRALQTQLGPWLVALPSSYGMHLTAVATDSAALDHASRALLRHRIQLHDLGRYFLGPPIRSGLVFGLGVVEPAEIERGVAALRRALAG